MSIWSEFASDTWETVEEFTEDTIDSGADFVADTCESLCDWHDDIIESAVGAVKDALDWSGIGGKIVIWLYAEALVASFEGAYAILNWLSDIVMATFEVVAALFRFLGSSFFQALSDLLNLTSKDYREFMEDVQEYVGDVAIKLGMSADYINLLLRDAQILIFDTSALFGEGYNLGQVAWLKQMDTYLDKFSGKMDIYAENPLAISQDMNDWIIGPVIDTKAKFMGDLITSLNDVKGGIDEFRTKIDTLRTDLDKTIHDLPSKIGEDIWDDVGPALDKYDSFIEDTYTPVMEVTGAAIAVLETTQSVQANEIGGLTEMLRNPGDVMAQIDALGEEDRLRQENAIGEIASRRGVRAVQRPNQSIADNFVQAGAKWDKIIIPKTKPAYAVKEVEGPVTPAFVSPKPRSTWFVGDF